MTDLPAAGSPISRIDNTFKSLNGALVTGAGSEIQFSAPVVNVSMQVSWTSNPSVVKVILQGTIDRLNWFTLATMDTGASGASGDIVGGSTLAVIGARANVVTLTGGTAPAVTAVISARGGI